MENLRLRYGDRVDFVKVYVSEAHPTDEVRFHGGDEEKRGQRMIGYYRMIHKAYTASPHTHLINTSNTHTSGRSIPISITASRKHWRRDWPRQSGSWTKTRSSVRRSFWTLWGTTGSVCTQPTRSDCT